jgi:hypothetical protein
MRPTRAPDNRVIFPTFVPFGDNSLVEISRGEGFELLLSQAFNFGTHGAPDLQATARLLRSARCLRLQFANVQVAINLMSETISA